MYGSAIHGRTLVQRYTRADTTMLPAEKPAFDEPRAGDVVITKEGGRFYLRVMPHPHRLSFAEFEKALRIATQSAAASNCGIWQTSGDGVYEPVRPLPATAEDQS